MPQPSRRGDDIDHIKRNVCGYVALALSMHRFQSQYLDTDTWTNNAMSTAHCIHTKSEMHVMLMMSRTGQANNNKNSISHGSITKKNCNSDESITATIIFLYIYIGGVCYIQFEIENASLWYVTSTVTSCGIQTHNSVLAATQMNGLNDHTVFVVRALEWSQTCLCVSYDMPIIRLKR